VKHAEEIRMSRSLDSSARAALGMSAVGAALALTARFARTRRASHFSFRDRVVIITGGARGFGLAIARALAPEGPRLFLLSRTGAELAEAKADLQTRGAWVETIGCDIRECEAVNEAVERVVAMAGRVDVLINNAGIIQMAPFENTQIEDFEDSLDTHFRGPLYLIRACLPHMSRGARIVNIASVGGRVAVPHMLPYCVGKFALVGLSDGLRAELAKDGIAVTTVSPWLMVTGSHRNVLTRGQRKQEARLFAVGSAVAGVDVDRSARGVVHACREGRARFNPGWPADLAVLANAVAPELFETAMSMAVRFVLPKPETSARAGEGAYSRDLDLGWWASIFPTRAAQRMNQPRAVGETR
jgi:NAD(P)-dependent dehydrogenase (short-subunit alcohol dehydrogenase family)